ncbi:hypothetical protein J3T91_04710 [Bifidobacterium sp. B4001]|uniref:hypothetical protein n=1 Tax=unclassified Bifidobacterium TaxID=2608897 RepID=UPI00226B0FCF|nr:MULTISPECIES: hypothetical protein [unclassified Bifidobacterium]MCX8672814.1 hypothetical protein [Bifidobacterium sp. B4079]MCX8681247.1 hypothetical protein [Bifidobacterium sp. B4001]
MADKRVMGKCHICGRYRKLSFEHIPPQSAGNVHKHLLFTAEELLKPGSPMHTSMDNSVQDLKQAHVHYKQLQRGAGLTTICEECNNYLGQNYVTEFVNLYSAIESWCTGPDAPVYKSGTHGEIPGISFTVNQFKPLAFFKQVISNFATCLPYGKLPGVDYYLTHRENTHFPKYYKLRLMIWPKRPERIAHAGWSKVFVGRGLYYKTAKLIIPPFVFNLYDTRNNSLPPSPLGGITAMSDVPFGETRSTTFSLPLLSDEQVKLDGFLFT